MPENTNSNSFPFSDKELNELEEISSAGSPRVRAKFKVEGRSPDGAEITMRPVVSGSVENDRFFSLTPTGQIVLNTINPNAQKAFELGAEYYVDFTRALP